MKTHNPEVRILLLLLQGIYISM